MLKTVRFRLIFAFLLLGYLFININLLLTAPVSDSGIKTENLHLKKLSSNKPSRGSLNYDLYVTENNEHYKIGADYADCFYYSDFMNKVAVGAPIKLGIMKDNGFFSKDLKLVVSIDANGINFLDSKCVNIATSNDARNSYLFGGVGLIVLYFLFHYQEQKDIKKKKSIQ